MKLWCFLHAFQKSPYRYLYLADILEALSCLKSETAGLEELFSLLAERNDTSWWRALDFLTEQTEKEERPYYLQDQHQFVFYGGPGYPSALMHMSDPPLALSFEGDLSPFEQPSLSVVGSREPHDYSKYWMQSEFYNFLKQHPVPIISGGARGIDQISHRIALFTNSPTLVVLPSGLAQKYPSLWQSSQEWVDKGVCFVSEMRLGDRISKKNFSCRNRIIAALGSGLLIVEAKEKSGTLITAHHALIESRTLYIVPAHPQQRSFAGSLQLLSENGGQMVRDAFDLGHYFYEDLRVKQI